MWPDWAIYWTLGNFLRPLAAINLPKSSTFLGNFCKGVKIIHFTCEIILGNFYSHLAIFIWSHWSYCATLCLGSHLHLMPQRWAIPNNYQAFLSILMVKYNEMILTVFETMILTSSAASQCLETSFNHGSGQSYTHFMLVSYDSRVLTD